MRPSKQDLFNQYRENTIIEIVQALAKSKAGSRIAFKGGTALKLFYGLPRYSEDVDYDTLPATSSQELFRTIQKVIRKHKWEITDEAIKYYTILVELRFFGIERNFRVKIEISTREKMFDATVISLRGVGILTLEPSFLMTEKLLTFLDREAGRDIFDAWFILNNAYPLNDLMIQRSFGDELHFYEAILTKVENSDRKKIFRDTGKLLGQEYRNWMKTSFIDDFSMLLRNRIKALELDN
jgi:predicted nucleotidyltransferase component of viral defense system